MLGEIDSPVGTLKSTLRAARQISGSAGGFTETFRLLATFDLDTYIAVAAAGLGKKPADVEDKVYEVGLPNLVESFSKYVEYLSNGGKPLKAPVEGSGAGEA